MASPPSLRPLAPSINLLRFLRSQSESLSFFASNFDFQGNSKTETAAAAQRHLWTSQCERVTGWSQGYSVRCPVATEASLIPIFCKRPKKSDSFSNSVTLNSQHLAGDTRNDRVQFFRSGSKHRPFLRQLLGLKHAKHEPKLKRDDLPADSASPEDGQEGNLFYVGRTLTAKAPNELRLRCTEFDENGNVTLADGEFKKSELVAKYGLLPRDLRKIDSSVLPRILVRHSAILISLLHLRVLIKSDRVLVFDAYGSADSYIRSLFMYDLEGRLRQKESGSRQASSAGTLPYEFRALEAVLTSVTSGLEAEFEGVREPVVQVLRALEEDIDRDKLRHLLIYSKRLGTFEQKARLVRDAIEDLLEADDDLASMYLTERASNMYRAEHDHQEVEMLLEFYHKVCDEIVQASGNLVTNIRNTEEIIKAILDANRNSLMLLDLKFSIGTLGLASGTLFSALYGMNLKNFLEEAEFGFATISGTCFLFSALVCTYGLMKLRRVQRVRMWGEGGIRGRGMGPFGIRVGSLIGNRGNWRSDSVDPVLAGLGSEGRAERQRRLRKGAAAGVTSSGHRSGSVATRRAVSANVTSRIRAESDLRSSNAAKPSIAQNMAHKEQETGESGSFEIGKAEESTVDRVFSSAR